MTRSVPCCCGLLVASAVLVSVPLSAEDKPFGLAKRVAMTTSRVHGTPEPPPPFRAVRAFPKLTFEKPLHLVKEPTSERLLVTEQRGRIHVFTHDPETETTDVWLDVGRETYSLCFHPRYAENGYVYVFSNGEFGQEKEKRNRIARYTVKEPSTGKPDPDSELVVLEWQSAGHNGHYLEFGPDGMLWISAGDGTVGMDPELDGQDVSNLRGTMIRIDVDRPAKDRPYSVPKDNPFVGRDNTRPEIWAFGFRNPYRFTFDPTNGALWVADIGQDAWEMVYHVTKGGNYGWSIMEGPAPLNLTRPQGPGPIVPPIIAHPHSEMRSITGGFFYRGTKYPSLQGAYLYGDYDTRRLFGARYDYDTKQVTWQQELASTTYRILSIGEDRDREILMVSYTGELLRIEPQPPEVRENQSFPKTLGASGLFDSVQDHGMAAGVIPYSVNSPLWSDGAHKDRFIAVPGTGQVTFRETRAWDFPQETVLVKTFSLDMEEGNPASRRRIETRFLHLQTNGEWAGYSYRWNDEQTDAVLVESAGRDEEFTIRDSSAQDGRRTQTWRYPSRAECMVCHTREARYLLGLTTLQMNRDHDYGGVTDNQIRALEHVGFFANELPMPPAELDRLPDPLDATQPLDARAKSYLHANCFHCHVEDGGGNAEMILEFGRPPEVAKILDVKPRHITFDVPDARLIAPGSPERSVILHRLSRVGKHQMPPVARNRVDEQALEMLEAWIRGLE